MRNSLKKPVVILLIVIFILSIAIPASAQSGGGHGGHGGHGGQGGYITHVVKPGERLASIARLYCTTWQEIYNLNRHTIGPDPDRLYPGMWLTIPNHCGGHPPIPQHPIYYPPEPQHPIDVCYGVYDRGWMPHAQGQVYEDYYYVLSGDTWYSIGKRFGVPYQHLQSVNGTRRLLAGWTIFIPCLGPGPGPWPTPEPWPTPTPIPPITPTPTPTPSPGGPPYIYIISPLANAVLPITFEVKGAAWHLDGYNVLVKAVDQHGQLLAQQTVALQQIDGVQANTSGQFCLQVQGQTEGCIIWTSQLSASVQNPNQDTKYWSAHLTVNVPAGTQGRIEVTAPGTNASAIINPVFFGQGGGGGGGVDYPPGQCQITVAASAPAYDQPNGTVVGQFSSAGTLESQRRELVNSIDWYRVRVQVASQWRDLWVSSVNLTGIGGGCY